MSGEGGGWRERKNTLLCRGAHKHWLFWRVFTCVITKMGEFWTFSSPSDGSWQALECF